MIEPTTPGELLAALDTRLRVEHGVDLVMADTVHRLAELSPNEGVQEVRQLLLQRASDMQSSVADISSAMQQLRELQHVLPFTAAGWPERHRELSEACKVDALSGIGRWLEDWFTALAAMRLDACGRLVSMGESLPPGTEVLLRRCRATAGALADESVALGQPIEDVDWWPVAAPLISAGAHGLQVGKACVPAPEIRQQLFVLLIRLSLALNRPQDARAALTEAKNAGETPVLEALRERLRLIGVQSRSETLSISSTNSADALLEAARVLIGTSDTDASDLQIDAGMAAARKAVAASGSLEEAQRQVVRMLGPIPAHIHLALAERAVAENDDALASDAANHAVDVGTGGAVVAEAHERLAEIAQRAGDNEDCISERVLAAETWSSASRPDRSLSNAEQALSLDRAHGEATCWVAASLMQLFWSSQGSSPSGEGTSRNQRQEARQQLNRALKMADDVANSKSPEIDNSDRAWAFYLVSVLADRLADFDGEPSREYHWMALKAELEALLLQPGVEGDWLRLADAAVELELWSLAELAAHTAVTLSLSPRAGSELTRALINCGKYDEAIELLDEPTDSFEWSMKGHLYLHRGELEEAVAVFNEHPPEPDSDWARASHIAALLLTGRSTEGFSAARDLDAWLRPRFAESGTWEVAAWTSALLGDHRRVETIVAKQHALHRNGSDLALAMVRASENQMQEAADLLKSYVNSITTSDGVAQWDHVDLPLLKLTMASRSVRMPDLSAVTAALQQVRAELERRSDPLVELETTAAAAADVPCVSDAVRLAHLMIAVARNDTEIVENQLLELASERDSSSLSALKRWLEEQRSFAADLGESADTPAEGDQETVTEPELAPVRVQLPSSWFDGMADPTREHPLFIRHLREMRLLTGDAVPPVRIAADEELGSDGYVISLHDEVVEQGTLPMHRRLLPASALPLLPDEGDLTQPEQLLPLQQLGELTIPDTEHAADTLDGLLSRSALEVLVARIEQLSSAAPPEHPPG